MEIDRKTLDEEGLAKTVPTPLDEGTLEVAALEAAPSSRSNPDE